MIKNEAFMHKAEELKPEMLTTYKEVNCDDRELQKGDEFLIDLGDHYVGYVTMELETAGRHLDAPVYF